MKINENCLPCLISQVIKVANITNIKNRDMFYRGVFQYLGKLNFTKTNPEIIGATFESKLMMRIHILNFGNIITNFSYHVVLNLKIRSTLLKRLLNMQLLEILLILVLSIIPKLKTLISGLKILIN